MSHLIIFTAFVEIYESLRVHAIKIWGVKETKTAANKQYQL